MCNQHAYNRNAMIHITSTSSKCHNNQGINIDKETLQPKKLKVAVKFIDKSDLIDSFLALTVMVSPQISAVVSSHP